MDTNLMTILQAAEYLQISRETLYKYAQSGRIPSVKVGRHWRFSRTALDAWVNQAGASRSAFMPQVAALPPVAAGEVPAPSATPTADPGPLRVLVVDDEDSLRRLMGAWVERLGHQVQLAATGEEALALLGNQTFDILFLDLHLTDMNGTYILSRLPNEHRPAVVLITGVPGGKVMQEALRHPVTYALSKPFQKADFDGVIEMIRVSREKA